MPDYEVLGIIFLLGSFGSLASSFAGDSGWHFPTVEQGIFRPGFIGNMFVGGLAALASWGMSQSINFNGPHALLTLTASAMANALVVGFGGASWFKSQVEQAILRKTAVVAAGKKADVAASCVIATATPIEALRAATRMAP